MTIEVFADIWCPFTHVGLRRVLAARRSAGRDDVLVVVRAWPLELVNGAPMDGQAVRAKADALRTQVAPELFSRVDGDHFPSSTLGALALESRAHAASAADGERASLLLRDALFEEGRDIADAGVLADLARRIGVGEPDEADRARVLADYEEGRRRGVLGSPHFFHGDVEAFCPALHIARDAEGALDITPDTARLDEFLARCFRR